VRSGEAASRGWRWVWRKSERKRQQARATGQANQNRLYKSINKIRIQYIVLLTTICKHFSQEKFDINGPWCTFRKMA
jgi:hypothetical protein